MLLVAQGLDGTERGLLGGRGRAPPAEHPADGDAHGDRGGNDHDGHDKHSDVHGPDPRDGV